MNINTKKSPSEEYKKAFRDGFNEALRIIKCDIDDLAWKACFPRE